MVSAFGDQPSPANQIIAGGRAIAWPNLEWHRRGASARIRQFPQAAPGLPLTCLTATQKRLMSRLPGTRYTPPGATTSASWAGVYESMRSPWLGHRWGSLYGREKEARRSLPGGPVTQECHQALPVSGPARFLCRRLIRAGGK
jgi:hypothetical protein